MSQVINTNVPSLNSQRQLNRSQVGLQTAMERLSSGLRINSAKDDAAGLAISERMTSQIRGLNQAVRNANDGISMSQVAEGALQESSNILQRIRELAIQSANDTNSGADRANIQKEVNQLKSELDRIATTTSFNNKLLLSGDLSSALFQVGANANQNINISIGSTKTSDYGTNELVQATTAVINTAVASTVNGVTASTLTVKGSLGEANVDVAAADSALKIASAVNSKTDATGVSAQAITYAEIGGAATANQTISFDLQGSNATAVNVSATFAAANDFTQLAQAINGVSGQTGVTAQLSGDKTSITLVHATGEDIKLTNAISSAATVTVQGVAADGSTVTGSTRAVGTAASPITVGGNVSFYSAKGFTVQDTGTTVMGNTANATYTASLQTVATVDVSTQSDSNKALNIVDGALSYIADIRADLGALQNRFGSTISNLENVSQNVAASRSRIQDADFAKESSELARNQILQQAGLSMLAQANATTQNVMTLLQG